MSRRFERCRLAVVGAVVLTLAGALTPSAVGSAGAASTVRGFDGTTITVAGFGIKALLPTIGTGAEARFKRFNDTNEIKGIKINMTEFADDGQDPATALSIARRLVTGTRAFAIVPNGSADTPGTYLTQQHVPWFGGGFDYSYCSTKPSTKVWGFSEGGCIVPQHPSFVSDLYGSMYKFVSEKTGKKHPTLTLFANDNATGKNSARIFKTSAAGTGFDVVSSTATLPLQVSDYTPYVQQIMTSNHGSQPDSVFCTGAVQCLPVWQLMQANGYKGYYFSGLYTDAVVKALSGSYVNITFTNTNENTPGVTQLKADADAFKPGEGSKVDLGTVFGYTSADFFIQALKKVAAKGKSNITPENVQKAASTMTWQIKGLMGPIEYPKATVMTYPGCFTNSVSDGTRWTVVEPLTCSRRTFKP